jgi:predicted transcriptional regulator
VVYIVKKVDILSETNPSYQSDVPKVWKLFKSCREELSMGVAKYRPAIKIILKLLECISKSQSKGRALKTHIIQCANLKTISAEKYIQMLKDAGYVEEKRVAWGAREVIEYELTTLGKARYEWFKTINDELFILNEWVNE